MATRQEFSRSNREVHFGKVVGSIPTAPTISRVDSVALALSSADSGQQKAGVLVQSWSKASTKQRERLTPCESAFLLQNHCNAQAELQPGTKELESEIASNGSATSEAAISKHWVTTLPGLPGLVGL